MFHKDGSFNTTQGKKAKDVPLKKSERRKLRDAFCSIIPNLPIESIQTVIDPIFTDTTAEISIRKIKHKDATSNAGATNFYIRTPSSSALGSPSCKDVVCWPYTQYHQVLLIELNQNVWIPSLALLSVLPEPILSLIPTVTVSSVVSKYLCRGANLMRSGISSVPSNCLPGGIVAISVRKNVQPFAVGFLTKGTDKNNIGPNTKGIGVEIITCYGDEIYRSQIDATKRNKPFHIQDGSQFSFIGGGYYDQGNYGNVGFVDGQMVYGLIRQGEKEDDSDVEDMDHNDVLEEKGEEKEEEAQDTSHMDLNGNETNNQDQIQIHANVKDGDTELESKMYDMQMGENESDTTTIEAQDQEVNEINMEEILLTAFHKALVYLSKSDLPISVPVFYSQHLLNARQEGTYINIKSTKWKKLGAFLIEQAQKGLIVLGASKDGKDPIAFIKSVDRGHIDLREARQNKKEAEDDNDNGGTTKQYKRSKLALIDLFVIPNHIVNLMNLNQDDVRAINAKSDTRKGTGFLTATECREILNKYLTENSLIDEFDPEMVKLNGPLCDALYKKSKKELLKEGIINHVYDEYVSRKDLNTKWFEKQEVAHAIVSIPGSNILSMCKGLPPKIHIEVARRQGNKFVTLVRGLENYEINASDFAKDVSRRFACSASVDEEPLVSLQKGHIQLLFQGNLEKELQSLLTGDEKKSSHGGVKNSDYNLPSGIIEVTLKRGVTSRNKK